LIDPHGGERDLRAGILRHVSPAFVEDPVRILRVARFAARFGFNIAPETLALMRRMVDEGESDALVPERVWQEFSKGLMEPQPERLFEALAACGLLPRLLPELDLSFAAERGDAPERLVPANIATRAVMGGLRHASRDAMGLTVRFALLAFSARGGNGGAKPDSPQPSNAPNSLRALAARLRAPVDCAAALVLAGAQGARVQDAGSADAAAKLGILEAADAFRREGRLHDLIAACECARAGLQGWVEKPYPPRLVLEHALAAARSVDAEAIVKEAKLSNANVNTVRGSAPRKGDKGPAKSPGADLAGALRKARIAAIEKVSE
jgi:tRNA nucleotidyltransferase (CCA-adding enzyme)